MRGVGAAPAMAADLVAWALVVLLGPVLAAVIGAWVYRDAHRRGHVAWAPWIALAVGGLFLTGSVPGLVAFAVAGEPAVEGFPTALRVIPGLVALAAYVAFR